MHLIHSLLDLLFPPKCVFCRALLESGTEQVCPDCAKKLLHMECTDRSGEFFDTCVAPFPYVAPVRDSLLRYKFHGATHYVDCYGELLAACVSSQLAASMTSSPGFQSAAAVAGNADTTRPSCFATPFVGGWIARPFRHCARR